jgi:hypothetical protein
MFVSNVEGATSYMGVFTGVNYYTSKADISYRVNPGLYIINANIGVISNNNTEAYLEMNYTPYLSYRDGDKLRDTIFSFGIAKYHALNEKTQIFTGVIFGKYIVTSGYIYIKSQNRYEKYDSRAIILFIPMGVYIGINYFINTNFSITTKYKLSISSVPGSFLFGARYYFNSKHKFTNS